MSPETPTPEIDNHDSTSPYLRERGQFQDRSGKFNSLDSARAEMNADLDSRPVIEEVTAEQSEAGTESVVPVAEGRRSAEQVGAERLDAAKAWVLQKYEKGKATVGKAGKFLGRLGLGILGVDQAARNVGADAASKGREVYTGAKEAVGGAATAAVESGREAYKHASEAIKNNATQAGERIKGAWDHAVEVRDRAVENGRNKFNSVVEKGRSFRDTILEKFNDVAIAAQLRAIEAKINNISLENTDSEQTISRIQERVGANNEAIATMREQIEAIKARRSSGGSQTAPAAA